MELREVIREAIDSLASHRRRAAAASIGLFWAAAAMVLLLAWGGGFREFMRVELQSFGPRVVVLNPSITGSGFAGFRENRRVRIRRADAAQVERANAEAVEALLPEHISGPRLTVEGLAGRSRSLDLSAADERYAHYRSFEVRWGRFFDASEVSRARAVAVLGHDAAVDLAGSPEAAVGARIRVRGLPFTVVGVAAKKGRQYTSLTRPDNRLLIVPITTAEEQLGFDEEAVSRLLLFPRPDVDGALVTRRVIATLSGYSDFHPMDERAIRKVDLSTLLGMVDLFYSGFTIFIGVTGTLTLLVGAIGVANHQIAVIAERTAEIAIAKAMGARNRTLVQQVVAEALITGSLASLAGVTLGLLGCLALATLPPPHSIPGPIVSPLVTSITLVALIGVAVVTWLLPAGRVRTIDVSTALRSTL
jgi:putative ABC transport system permease protein